MKNLALIAVMFLLPLSAFTGTIISTDDGGNWNEPSTWIGFIVPGATDSVIINGPVRLLNYNNECLTVMVNEGKDLWAGPGWYGYLTVFGDLVNYGTIYGGMDISVTGNIYNNGLWIDGDSGRPIIHFIGTDQHISQNQLGDFNSSFWSADSTVNIFLDSDIRIFNENSTLGNAEIITQGHICPKRF